MQKKFAFAALAVLLAACSGPLDYTIAESNEPEKARKILEALSPEDRQAFQTYVANHTMKGDLDYKTTIKEAVKIGKTEKSMNPMEAFSDAMNDAMKEAMKEAMPQKQ
ncbi:MAG: hypothetical protein FWF20_04840 [Betaproteobacteria bacterium]|nr:hypothetical protein [Betaproteobacteria bacterium]MCL2886105.1 hypothetical protein [Betaproteobacteria bacterium]